MNNETTKNLVSNTIQVNGMLSVSLATTVALQAYDKVLEVVSQETNQIDTILKNGRDIFYQSKGMRSIKISDKRHRLWEKKRTLDNIYYKVATLRYNLRIELK